MHLRCKWYAYILHNYERGFSFKYIPKKYHIFRCKILQIDYCWSIMILTRDINIPVDTSLRDLSIIVLTSSLALLVQKIWGEVPHFMWSFSAATVWWNFKKKSFLRINTNELCTLHRYKNLPGINNIGNQGECEPDKLFVFGFSFEWCIPRRIIIYQSRDKFDWTFFTFFGQFSLYLSF